MVHNKYNGYVTYLKMGLSHWIKKKKNPATSYSQDTLLKQIHSEELKRKKWEQIYHAKK